MTQEELRKTIENHQHYLKKDCECWSTKRADLSYAYLSYANLRGANLRDANLSDADLRDANLSDADLRGADLRGANLSDANLSYANLSDADLSDADLRGADLRGTDLSGANLSDADLRDAYLSYANLRGADLSDANLSDADLRGANLRGANLSYAKYNETTTFLALQCPEKGSFIAFKKIGNFIIELEVPAEAKRSSATTRKCRCEFAKVLSITNIDGSDSRLTSIHNGNYCGCDYVVGEIVRSDKWDDNRWNECSHGIHFFITRDEAVDYNR